MKRNKEVVKWPAIFIFLIILAICETSAQQKHCGDGRYVYDIFEVTDSITVKYGENTTVGGNKKELFMDVYQPLNDIATKRPVILFAFGGSFLDGDRGQVRSLCRYYAKKGYVTAGIEYRLYDGQGIPDSIGVMDVAIKAMGDVKAAVRYFRKDEATINQFKIDPDFIMVGGLSSGSISCLHAAYMDKDDDIPSFIEDVIKINGGFEGDSGDEDNLKYSSSIQGVINYFGGVYKSDWINKDEAPIVSIHGDKDDVVAYEDGKASIKLGTAVLTSVSISGSGSIHKKASSLSLSNHLITVPDGGHGEFLNENIWSDSMLVSSTQLLHDKIVCPDYVGMDISSKKDYKIQVFPNPSHGSITILVEDKLPTTLEIIDATGRVILMKKYPDNQSRIILKHLSPGLYFLKAYANKLKDFRVTEKIIVY